MIGAVWASLHLSCEKIREGLFIYDLPAVTYRSNIVKRLSRDRMATELTRRHRGIGDSRVWNQHPAMSTLNSYLHETDKELTMHCGSAYPKFFSGISVWTKVFLMKYKSNDSRTAQNIKDRPHCRRCIERSDRSTVHREIERGSKQDKRVIMSGKREFKYQKIRKAG